MFRLPSLVTLDVSNNKLRELPFQMWRAPKLKELNAAFNLLRELPAPSIEVIFRLFLIRILNFSGNEFIVFFYFILGTERQP